MNFLKIKKETTVIRDDFYMKYFIFDIKVPLIITFHFAEGIPTSKDLKDASKNISPFGYDYIKAHNYNVISFSPLNINHWYRAREFHSFLHFIQKDILLFDIRLGYGSSMGAYAISAFSDIFEFTNILLFSPISTLNEKKAFFETRFFHARKNLDWEGEYNDGATTKTKGFIVYDPLHHLDSQHVNRYGNQLVRIKLPGSGHNVPRMLLELKVLKSFVLDFIENKLKVQSYIKDFKRRRFLNFYYVNLLSSVKMTDKRSCIVTKYQTIMKSKNLNGGCIFLRAPLKINQFFNSLLKLSI